MKKLMIAAAIVCAAVASQAASFEWNTVDSIYGIKDATLASGLAAGTTYGADGNDIDTLGWTVGYVLTLSNGVDTDTLKGTVETDGAGFAMMSLASSLVEKGEEAYNLDYTLTYTATVTDGQGKTWELTSDTIEDVFTVKKTGDLTLNTDGASTWSTAAVPEPTSGLLLLLGVAGLALRRRRA